MKKILIVCAHPDDEVLGCGATISRLTKEGYKAYTLLLGEGITARDNERNIEKRKDEINKIRECAIKAGKIIGVEKVFVFGFPDNRFDAVPFLDIVKTIEKIKDEVSPDIVYTHHRNDLNIDHRITYGAALTACRPLSAETVKEIYSFEVPSSTQWNYPVIFSPNFFMTVDKEINGKISALKCYKSEIGRFPHPRSEEAVRNNARHWGSVAGVDYAEAFEAIRIIK